METESFIYEDYVDDRMMARKLAEDCVCSYLDHWGDSADTNILYITGHSGSGKSTMAIALADKSTDIIHLDAYFDEVEGDPRCKEFDRFLKSRNAIVPNSVPLEDWKRLNVFKKFEEAVYYFGENQYEKNRKVIAEGIQIADHGLYEDHRAYLGRPLIIIRTGTMRSLYRRITRDGVIIDIKTMNGVRKLYKSIGVYLDQLAKVTRAKKDDYLMELLD